VRTIVDRGNPVIFDHVLHDRDMFESWQKAFNGLAVFSVGVVCPIDILEARERTRGDRSIGRARGLVDVVHSFCSYDIVVDTGLAQVDARVAEILARLASDWTGGMQDFNLRPPRPAHAGRSAESWRMFRSIVITAGVGHAPARCTGRGRFVSLLRSRASDLPLGRARPLAGRTATVAPVIRGIKIQAIVLKWVCGAGLLGLRRPPLVGALRAALG